MKIHSLVRGLTLFVLASSSNGENLRDLIAHLRGKCVTEIIENITDIISNDDDDNVTLSPSPAITNTPTALEQLSSSPTQFEEKSISNKPSEIISNIPTALVPPSLSPSQVEDKDSICTTRINHLRSKFNIPLITERKDLHTCANRQSEYDKQVGAHKSFKRCGSVGSQGSGGGNDCAGVIDMFYHERWRCYDNGIDLIGSPYKVTDDAGERACRAACMDDLDCLSFGFNASASTNPCSFYNDASATYMYPYANEDDAYWLGDPDIDNGPSTTESWRNFTMINVDGSNSVPSTGTLSEFKWFGKSSDPIDFHVFRLVSNNEYEVIGTINAPATNVGQVNFLAVNPPISVKKGDVLGFTYIGNAAIGFDDSLDGQYLYSDENSGGPSNVGDMWTFTGGPTPRRYYFSARFNPDTKVESHTAEKYCAAGLCRYHCGPVMSRTTTTYSWGVYENFYTLNWRPNPTMPMGGDTCPSGINVVRCWEDTSSNILWAYGVGGEDCNSICSLAGASSLDYKCNENVPITGGLDEVSSLMSNFENPYNENDADEFTCTKGGCWNGGSSNQVMIHEYNSNCYVPLNDDKYVCTARFGNANCFGQRFNQLCPCTPGCSYAAGPTCEE